MVKEEFENNTIRIVDDHFNRYVTIFFKRHSLKYDTIFIESIAKRLTMAESLAKIACNNGWFKQETVCFTRKGIRVEQTVYRIIVKKKKEGENISKN